MFCKKIATVLISATLILVAACDSGTIYETPEPNEPPVTTALPSPEESQNETPHANDSTGNIEHIDVPEMQRYVVSPYEIGIDGYSGFAIYLDDEYDFVPWAGEDGWYRVTYEDGPYIMNIGQHAHVGKTAEEWMQELAQSIFYDDADSSYETPTEDLPFFMLDRFAASGEGNIMQYFVCDNGFGGVFEISIVLSLREWDGERGTQLLYSLSLFEVLVEIME